MLDLPATPALVGNGRNRTSCPKGLRLQRSDGTSLPRCWLQRIEANDLPRGYEPRELPMLHAASKVARLELTRMRRSTSVRSQNWRTAEVLIPNALRHPSRFERARGTRRVDCPLDHDPIMLNRDHGLAFCLSMIFSENRFPLFGIMLYWRKTANSNRTPVKVPAAFQAVPVRLSG